MYELKEEENETPLKTYKNVEKQKQIQLSYLTQK